MKHKRCADGRWKKGNPGGPGRPPTEECNTGNPEDVELRTYARDGVLRPAEVEALAEEGAEKENIVPYLKLEAALMADGEANAIFEDAYRNGEAARAIALIRAENRRIKSGSVQALIKALEASIARYQDRPPVVDEAGLVRRVEGLFKKLDLHRAGIRDGSDESSAYEEARPVDDQA